MPMYEGSWPCSSCGGTITQLPFQPRSTNGLTCRDCWSKSKGGTGTAPAVPAPIASEPMPEDDIPDFDESQIASEPMSEDGFDAVPVTPGEKPRFTGAWHCSNCDGDITSLPFQPRDTSNLKCLDCFKASR